MHAGDIVFIDDKVGRNKKKTFNGKNPSINILTYINNKNRKILETF